MRTDVPIDSQWAKERQEFIRKKNLLNLPPHKRREAQERERMYLERFKNRGNRAKR